MGGRVVSFLDSLPERVVLVFGAGVTGKSTVEFLNSMGARTLVVDERGTGGAKPDLVGIELDQVAVAIVSPGWRIDHPLIERVRSAGIELISEIDLAWRVRAEKNPAQRWIGLTGTNGKTTTVQMTAAILLAEGINAVACGNVGDPVIEAVVNEAHEILVLELSSFQLAWSHELMLEAAALLNIAEDHLDWHGSFEGYLESKFKIAKLANLLVANKDDQNLHQRLGQVSTRMITYTLGTPAPHEIGLVENLAVDRAFVSDEAEVLFELGDLTNPVPHNVSNAMAAAALARAVGVSAQSVTKALREFQIDHHRLETVLEIDGIKWIDDSKATNPHAALAAIRSQLSVIWIAGGLSKGADMNELIAGAANRIRSAILIGTDAPIIAAALGKHAPDIEVSLVSSELTGLNLMREVVRLAKSVARPGDSVLLAPACASMDQFENYAQRGDLFAQAVREENDVR
jgi:UDP-N-acetylmuramoylalanine--D-glutamate ligase